MGVVCRLLHGCFNHQKSLVFKQFESLKYTDKHGVKRSSFWIRYISTTLTQLVHMYTYMPKKGTHKIFTQSSTPQDSSQYHHECIPCCYLYKSNAPTFRANVILLIFTSVCSAETGSYEIMV